MNGTEITILVISIVVGLYILLAITGVIFILFFRSVFKKHNAALTLMLHTKFDNIKKIVELLNKCEVVVPFKYIEVINSINSDVFKDQELPECLKARNDLAYLKSEFVYMISSNETLSKNQELRRAKDAITEMDANYRTLIAMYNADVLGYNYWINFLPTRYLKHIFKLKPKSII